MHKVHIAHASLLLLLTKPLHLTETVKVANYCGGNEEVEGGLNIYHAFCLWNGESNWCNLKVLGLSSLHSAAVRERVHGIKELTQTLQQWLLHAPTCLAHVYMLAEWYNTAQSVAGAAVLCQVGPMIRAYMWLPA